MVIHLHDIYIPGEYPEPWVMEGWGWNETTLVRGFLSFNDTFEILWGGLYMLYNHLDELLAAFPALAARPYRRQLDVDPAARGRGSEAG